MKLNEKIHIINSKGETELLSIYSTKEEAILVGEYYTVDIGEKKGYIGLTPNKSKGSSCILIINDIQYRLLKDNDGEIKTLNVFRDESKSKTNLILTILNENKIYATQSVERDENNSSTQLTYKEEWNENISK